VGEKMVILVAGSTGAGKTTYARKLAPERKALVYSIDNWVQTLYGADMPKNPSPEWFFENQNWYRERISRCEEMILELSLERAKHGQNSILDLGFTTREHRTRFIEYFKNKNISVETYFLDVPASERRNRVEKRNLEKGETFVMNVDDSLFEFMESIFEPPTHSEGCPVKVIKEN
jgi:predicted kinase